MLLANAAYTLVYGGKSRHLYRMYVPHRKAAYGAVNARVPWFIELGLHRRYDVPRRRSNPRSDRPSPRSDRPSSILTGSRDSLSSF